MWVAERCGGKGTGYFIFLTEASLCHIWRAIAFFKWPATCVCQIQVFFFKSQTCGRCSYVALENFTELALASFPLFSEKTPPSSCIQKAGMELFPPLIYARRSPQKLDFSPSAFFFRAGKGGWSAGRGNLPNLNISFSLLSSAKKLEASA